MAGKHTGAISRLLRIIRLRLPCSRPRPVTLPDRNSRTVKQVEGSLRLDPTRAGPATVRHAPPRQPRGSVIVARATKEWSNPQSRIVLERVRDNLIENGGRDTDVGDDDFAAQQPAGQQQMARFLRKKVTVRTAAAAPNASPVSPIRPLGTSMATIGSPLRAAAVNVSAAGPSSARRSPVPKIASTTNSARSSTAGVSGSTAPRHRSAC